MRFARNIKKNSDYFSKTGQLWRNPLYNWDAHKKENYRWWKNRFENIYNVADFILTSLINNNEVSDDNHNIRGIDHVYIEIKITS